MTHWNSAGLILHLKSYLTSKCPRQLYFFSKSQKSLQWSSSHWKRCTSQRNNIGHFQYLLHFMFVWLNYNVSCSELHGSLLPTVLLPHPCSYYMHEVWIDCHIMTSHVSADGIISNETSINTHYLWTPFFLLILYNIVTILLS